MSVLEHPTAQTLLEQATLSPQQVAALAGHRRLGQVGRRGRRRRAAPAHRFGAAARGGKKPGLTVSQLRQVFTRLLRRPRPGVRQIAEEINRVLRRNEEARIEHYLANTGNFPPPRPRRDSG